MMYIDNTNNWPSLLKKATSLVNNSPLSSTGLKPVQTKNFDDSIIIEKVKKDLNLQGARPKTLKEQKKIRRRFMKTNPLYKEGNYVFLKFDPKKLRDKSFRPNSGALFKIRQVDCTNEVVMFRLSNLKGQNIDGLFYASELQPFLLKKYKYGKWPVRKIFAQRFKNKRKQVKVLLDNNEEKWVDLFNFMINKR